MSDALVSPEVGGVFWIASAAVIAVGVKKVKEEYTERAAPLMGVLGAFVFAAQMINFSIPGTGSSGHLGGGILLAALLGPWAAVLTMASILAIQALFFADGGLLALGCNIFNMGILPCLVAWPLIYKPLAGSSGSASPVSRNRLFWGCFLASVIGLQLGAFGVVLETRLSGISELPFTRFVLLMQPIHLAIGAVEGLATAALILFVRNMQPSLLASSAKVPLSSPGKSGALKSVLLSLAVLAVLIGGVLSWFASSHPDGLEWAASRTSQQEELAVPNLPVYQSLASLQEKTAFLPDYGFRAPEIQEEPSPAASEAWPQVSEGTSLSGLLGGGIVFLLLLALGLLLKKKTPLPSC